MTITDVCPGARQEPRPGSIAGRDRAPNGALRWPGRGMCTVCRRDYKLTNDGYVRVHAAARP